MGDSQRYLKGQSVIHQISFLDLNNFSELQVVQINSVDVPMSFFKPTFIFRKNIIKKEDLLGAPFKNF